MGAHGSWDDLLDPSREELEQRLPVSVHQHVLDELAAKARDARQLRPKLEAHGEYIFGVFLVAVAVPEEDVVYYQELGLVLTEDCVVTVRKTPEGGRPPYDPEPVRAACAQDDPVAMVVYHLADDVAERYLDLVDALEDEIESLEDLVEESPRGYVSGRISEFRHDVVHIRRTLSPTRDAVRQIVDRRAELESGDPFSPAVRLAFGSVYDKLLRAADGLELARDLLEGVREFQQAKVANDQNEVVKRLTVIASLLLVPTFIVGVYGQNFDRMPELHWWWGYYVWSWGLIVVTTIGQLAFFRWRRWI
ncbi:MAG TPA: magnesium transporter CorA family protein [Gaiellaceae bacterium]|nr:magnesium transporter CorA family protein [Gaiellaceae bacterium]